jgi:general secretion pathway protein G
LKSNSLTIFLKKIARHLRKGSKLVEIMVAIAIIGLLTMLKVPNGRNYIGYEAKYTAAAVQIRELENALDLYRSHNGFYPTTEQGLSALVTKPATAPQPENYIEGGYLKKIQTDPWGNLLIYRSHGKEGPIDIISCGRDGIEGTEDDFTNKDI